MARARRGAPDESSARLSVDAGRFDRNRSREEVTMAGWRKALSTLGVVAVAAAAALTETTVRAQNSSAGAGDRQVTFTRDVAPILQRSCQTCHRPGMMAPMLLLTYQDARPWSRSIKTKVVNREMPPWFIRSEERRVGKECRS